MDFWELGLDGWIGAVVGSAVSIGVAVYVLRRTLAADRQQFVEQLEAERTFALEQRRLEAFGDLAGAMRKLQSAPPESDIPALYGDVTLAVSRWRMYLGQSVDVGLSMEVLGLALLRGASLAARISSRDWRRRVSRTVASAVENGRKWHLGLIDDDELKRIWDTLAEDMVADMPDELPPSGR
jgi:hypothetical protein